MKQKTKTPDFGNFQSFVLDGNPMEIDELEASFYEDMENKKIKWVIFGRKIFPRTDMVMCEDQMTKLYYDAQESHGNSYVREYSRKFNAVRYSRNKHLNTMEITKPIKPKHHVKRMIEDLKAIKEKELFTLKAIGTDQSTINAVRIAYKGCIEELKGAINKPRTQSMRDGVGPPVFA